MKKMHYFTAVAASAALVLTGCSAGGSSAASDGAMVLDMWAGSEEDTQALKAQVEVAKKANPDLKIELRTAPWGDFFTKLTTNMASGNMACITGMNSGMLAGYTGGFAKLSTADLKTAGIEEDDFAPGAFEILTNKGDLYGIPFDMSTMLAYYNEDILSETGAPVPSADWDFDDFEETVTTATTAEHAGFGIGMGGFQWQALPIAKSGVQPATEDGELDLTNPAFVDAATWYSGLVTEQKVALPVSSASDIGWGESQFASGAAAVAIDGTWNAVTYLNNDPGFTAGMAPLPAGKDGSLGLVLGSGYGISADCQDKEAALKVLGSLVSEEAQDSIASSGRSYPARVSSQPLYFESLDEEHRAPVKAAFEAAFSNVEGQYVTDNWSKVETFLQPQLVSVYSGQTSMADVLKSAQSQFGN
ncbi:ABC transporter substrate-binding protein [Mycetocola sp.]|uniref:ABC transporter substrate-binding protein n=1 Tax=Mycetocola sp. TaxID=1871042 RepID=UPI00398A1EA4